MNIAEAARRLNVAESHITSLAEHPAGHLATLRSGAVMLVAETVCRVYLPDVDDPQPEVVAEPEPVKQPADAEVVAAKPAKSAPKKKTSGGSGS